MKENMDFKNAVMYGVGIIFIIAVIFILFKSSVNKGKYKLKIFLTKNEKDCFIHLRKIFPDNYICPQVSMGAVIEPTAKINGATRQERSNSAVHRNQVQSKIIDYVILNKFLDPIFIVELDDNTHNSKIDKDKDRDNNISLAGLKTIRIRRNKNIFPGREVFNSFLTENKITL